MITIVPLFVDDTETFQSAFEEAVHSRCDWIELRLDRALNDLDPFRLLEILAVLDPGDKRLLYTIRTDREGGEISLTDTEYKELVRQLCRLNGLVDVELSRLDHEEPLASFSNPEQTVLSFHDFDQTPADLDVIWHAMETHHPLVQKIAVMPHDRQDVDRLLESCRQHRTESRKIAIAMGEQGTVSRLWGDAWDSFAAFCTLSQRSAPGQLSLEEWLVKRTGKNGPSGGTNC